MPVSDFGVIQRHIDCIPEDKLMTLKPEDVYLDIKTALYNIMTNEDESAALPSKMDVLIQKVPSYFSLRKTKANFVKEYTYAKDEKEPRWAKRKLAKERERTYIHAQHLGNALTMKGLLEFRDHYIDDKTTSILEEGPQTQVVTPAREDTTISITPTSETATNTIVVKKNCTLVYNITSCGILMLLSNINILQSLLTVLIYKVD
ncbi:hypothetical protein BDB01DRAFT_800219 [Pilobolus umbonatus]|nr:hypothetical protein BDB01DRAFT_800219 [Pilobolus umbonatus]